MTPAEYNNRKIPPYPTITLKANCWRWAKDNAGCETF